MRKAEIIRKKQHRRKGRRYYLTIFPMHIKTGERFLLLIFLIELLQHILLDISLLHSQHKIHGQRVSNLGFLKVCLVSLCQRSRTLIPHLQGYCDGQYHQTRVERLVGLRKLQDSRQGLKNESRKFMDQRNIQVTKKKRGRERINKPGQAVKFWL